MKLKTLASIAAIAALALLYGPVGSKAQMGSAEVGGLDLSDFFKERRPLDFPKPWPLQNLVTPGKLTVGITAKSPPGSFTNTSGQFDGSRVKLFARHDRRGAGTWRRTGWPCVK